MLWSQYADFANVFDNARTDELPDCTQYDLAIEIEDDKFSPFGPTYDHSRLKLEALHEYINEMLAKRFIRPFKSLSKAPIFFTKKNNGGLRMCVHFCSLNAITKKNKHPIPLVWTLLDLFAGAKRYTKIDIIVAYNTVRIRASDKWKTAFKCWYGHFEYLVMSFGLINALATF